MTLEEINAQIATLEQRIAEKKAMNSRMNLGPSKFDYIVSGDRSGLDRISQQRMAEEQAKLQREMTIEMNKQNKAIENVARQDEYVKNRNKAAATYQYAEEALDAANNSGDLTAISKAQRDLDLAKEDFNYWNNKTDNKLDITPKQPTLTPTPVEPKMNLDSQIEKYKAITGGKSSEGYAEILNEIKSNPNFGQSKELQAQYERINKLYKNRLGWEAEQTYIKNWKPGDPIKEGYEVESYGLDGKPSKIRKIKK